VRLTLGLMGSIALAMAIIGCSSAPAGPTLAPGQTATPVPATLVPGATATPAGAVITGHECDAVPTFDLSNPTEPSFPPDAVAESHFPATIDGQPVTDVHSQQWLYFLCYLGGQASFEQAAGQSGGVNMATSSFAQATATVDGEEVDLTAWRTPGTDANALVQYLALLAAQSGADITVANVQQTTIANKAVYTWTNPDDNSKSFAYPSGDTLVFFDGVTDSQANKILAALP
jgi:hypothetical protein